MTDSSREDLGHHRDGRARRAVVGVLWSGLNAFIPAISGAVVFLLVARILTPEEFGFVAFATAIIGTLGAFSPLGFGDALVQRDDLQESHLNVTFWMCGLWGAVLYGLVVVTAAPVSDWLDTPILASLLPVLGIRLIFDLTAVVPSALLSRKMHFRQIALRTLTASLVSTVVCLVVLYLGYGLWALVMSQLAAAVAVWAVSWLSVRWRPGLDVRLQALNELKGFGIYASGSAMITRLNVEQILIGALLGSGPLGLFSFARRTFFMLNRLLTGALGAVTYPLLSSLQNELPKLREAYLASTFLSSIVAFPTFVGLALIADDAIPLLFGPQWTEAVPALQAFCAIGLLSCIGILQSALVRSRGRADWWMWYQVGQQILTALVILALASFGVTAVVVGIALKTWLTFPLVAALVVRMVDLSPLDYLKQFMPPLLGCVAMAVAVLGLREAVDMGDVANLSAQIAVGAIAYAVTLAVISRRRLMDLRRIVKP